MPTARLGLRLEPTLKAPVRLRWRSPPRSTIGDGRRRRLLKAAHIGDGECRRRITRRGPSGRTGAGRSWRSGCGRAPTLAPRYSRRSSDRRRRSGSAISPAITRFATSRQAANFSLRSSTKRTRSACASNQQLNCQRAVQTERMSSPHHPGMRERLMITQATATLPSNGSPRASPQMVAAIARSGSVALSIGPA